MSLRRAPVFRSLLARPDELTSVPLADEYREGILSTPEVLLTGDIAAMDIAVVAGDGETEAVAPGGPAGS